MCDVDRDGEMVAVEQHPDPTVQRHRLRIELLRARDRAGLARRQVAEQLGWSESKLIRIERGQVRLSRSDLKALLDLYGVDDPDAFADLAELAEQSRRHPWKAYRDVLNAEFIVYLGYEGAACRLRSFQPWVIHGLLQTEDYTRSRHRAMALAPANGPDERVNRQIEARLKRQALLEKEDGPELWFILGEAAVRQLPGPGQHDREVMRAQLRRLKELAKRPGIKIQVMRFDQGSYPGTGKPFTVLEFPSGNGGGVIYMEGSRQGSMIRSDADEVALYGRLFEQLTAVATDPNDLDHCIDEVMP